MDIIVKGYTLSGNEISAVAYATYVYDFLENIIIPNAVTAKVFTGDGENTEIVRDGDVLRVSANGTETEYNISVLPASGEKDITSTEYSVFENEISGIPYNTSLSEFLEKITVPEYAAVSHHYEQGYTGAVYTGDEITVTAQNGDSKVYVLKVENGRTTADISGAAGIEINKKTGVISGAEKGESVSDFLSALTVTNGGKIKLYSADGEEKTSGVLSGGETVRVFPEYSTPGAEFDIYTVSCNSKLIGDSEIIVTVEDDGYSTNGDCYESGTAVEPGYNGITTVYPSNCTGRFTWQVTKSGAYSVYMYTSYHSSNKPYKAQLHSADGTEEATVHQEETSGWKLLGKYAFSAGEDGYIDITNDEGDNSGYARLSAVKIVPEGEYKNISDVALISENGEEKLREGVNRVKSLEGAKIKLTADAKIEKEDIKITSEYGNSLDFTLSEKDGAAMILPKYDLRKEVTYYISVNSEKLSKPYTYVLQHEKKISAAVALRVVNGTATVSLDAKNSGNGDETLTVFVCSFSDAFTMRECVVKSLTVSAGTEETITEKIGVESEGSVKVFLWDSVMNPVTKVYYR